MKSKRFKVKDIVPMKELEREFYDPSKLLNLKKSIAVDGFDDAYPIRVIWNPKLKKFEAFDGIHRLLATIANEIPTIPVIDETGLMTRQQALIKGIKANFSHASYNPIDMARHLTTAAESLGAVRKSGAGRPAKWNLEILAKQMNMSVQSVSNYLQLLDLPEDIQTQVGQGKLKFSLALVLLRLNKTAHKHLIPKLANEAVAQGISRRELERRVESVLNKGYYDDTKLCVGCKRAFPKEHLSYPCLCPSCIQKLRLGAKIEPSPNLETDKRNEAMRDFLKLNALLDERWTKKGKKIPEKAKEYLEELHEKWKNTFDENVETEDDIAIRDYLEDAAEAGDKR
jgi:ParB family chromosome partitioning protein